MTTDLFKLLWSCPTLDNYLRARKSLLRSVPLADRSSVALKRIERSFQAARWDDVLTGLTPIWPAWRLSSRAHFLRGVAAMELGDESAASRDRERFQRLMELVLQTGDGTAKRPYQVAYGVDEYDICRICDHTVVHHSVVDIPVVGGRSRPRRCDVLRGSDGESIWFDITDLLPAGIPLPRVGQAAEVMLP